MSATHSPAPWQIVKYGDGDSLVICEANADQRICFMATPGQLGDMRRIRANAALITAAPQLLVAARIGLKAMESDLAMSLESHCLFDHDLKPIRSTLDAEEEWRVGGLEMDIALVKVAIAAAMPKGVE